VDVSGDSETSVATHWKLYSVAGDKRVLQNMAFTHQKLCTGNIPDISAECDIVYTYVFYHIHSPGVLFKCHQVLWCIFRTW